MKLNDYVLIYYIHGNEPGSHEITKEGFKRGNSVKRLEEWAEQNDIYDYMIYASLWEVERNYINPLREIKRVSNIAADYVNSIVRTSESALVQEKKGSDVNE
jgi:hypothetical protein